jgi:preprotein translocase subunit SecB
MRSSPLQLLRYFVEEISCTSNPSYDVEKDIEVLPDQFRVDTNVTPPGDNELGSWTVQLLIRQQIGSNQNFPYEFTLSMIGFFICTKNLPDSWSQEYFVRINGSSLLYGVAREIIRATTARGPWSDLIVPTLSFYEPVKPSDAQLAHK